MRKKTGYTQAELAKRIGFVRHYISLVENGREPSHRFIRALELLEQAPLHNIVHSGSVREEPTEARPPGRKRKASGYIAAPTHVFAASDLPPEPGISTQVIPLLTWAQAGALEAWNRLDEYEGFIGLNVRDPKAVAVQVRGDMMEPQFPQGTIAIVYPSSEAKSGDLVIALLEDGTVMFKRLHADGIFYTFISTNPIYPPVTIQKSKVAKIFPVGATFQNHL